MIIGNFHYDADTDTYSGAIETLTFRRDDIELRPLRKSSEREPDYRVTATTESGTVELGAAWQRRSEKGKDFLSVLLDDPAFGQALNVALFTQDDQSKANLVWTRPARKAPEPTAEDRPARGGRRRAERSPAHG